MATFQFNERSIDLDFCGKLKFKLPLNDATARQLTEAGEYLKNNRPNENSPEIWSEMCDTMMDAIDMMLGEGAADQIAALKPGFNFWDASDVFQHISKEFYAALDREKGKIGNQQPVVAPSNRAQRRAAAKAKAGKASAPLSAPLVARPMPGA